MVCAMDFPGFTLIRWAIPHTGEDSCSNPGPGNLSPSIEYLIVPSMEFSEKDMVKKRNVSDIYAYLCSKIIDILIYY